MVWATCVTDCKDEYHAAVRHCKIMHDDPEDSDTLQACLDEARDDYQHCVGDCQ